MAHRIPITLAKPHIYDADWLRARTVIDSGHLVQGEVCLEVQEQLASFSEAESCLLVSSGTAALHLTMMAAEIGPGDAVICPAFTFPAPANSIELSGARTVFCDVDAQSCCATAELVEEALAQFSGAERVRAVVLVHAFGQPADAVSIRDLCDKHGLLLIEDAACALGSRYSDGRHVGTAGHIACYSFHPRKAVTCGEGGAVMGPPGKLMQRVELLRNHGIRRIENRATFVAAGLNYRLTDIQAALLPTQIANLPTEIERRRFLAQRYDQGLHGQTQIAALPRAPGHSFQSLVIRLSAELDALRLIASMSNTGVEVNYGATAVHLTPYYQAKYGYEQAHFPNASTLGALALALPLYGSMTEEDVDYVTNMLVHAIAEQDLVNG